MKFKKGNTIGMSTRFKKGHTASKEVRNKISKGNQIPKPKPEGFGVGRIQSDETKRKISEKKKGKFYPGTGFQKGHPQFNSGRTQFKRGHKQSEKWKEWRKDYVFPKKDTLIEVKIQNYLKKLGVDFFTHQYMHIKHGYQCDIFVPSMDLVIECDGDYWHKYPVGTEIDNIRTGELIKKGFKVLRLWEHGIKAMNVDDFQEILEEKKTED